MQKFLGKEAIDPVLGNKAICDLSNSILEGISLLSMVVFQMSPSPLPVQIEISIVPGVPF